MKKYLLLTKTLLSSFFRKTTGEKKSVSHFLIVGIISAILACLGALVFVLYGGVLGQLGIVTEITALIFDFGFIAMLVFGTIGIFSYIYFSKDSEFLMSLPVSPSTVYLSKLTAIYVQEVSLTAIFTFPSILALGISSAQPFTYYIMLVLGVITVPVCALLVSSIISVPLVYLASFFKKKGAISGIILIILAALIMTVYMTISLSRPTDMGAINIVSVLQTSASILYPFYCLARFGALMPGLLGAYVYSVVLDLGIYLATIIVLLIATIIISKKTYAPTVLRQSEHNVSRSATKTHVSSSVLKTLMKKEWRELYRNSSFAFQCLFGVVITPILIVVYIVMMGDAFLIPEMQSISWFVCWAIGFAMLTLLGSSINICAFTAVSREGKTFVYSKTISVPYYTQMLAKILLSNIIGGITILLSVISFTITTIAYGIARPFLMILTFVFSLLLEMTLINIGVRRDLKKPKLNWVTPREAVKNNFSSLIPMLVGMLASVLVLGACVGIEVWLTFSFGVTEIGATVTLAVFTALAGLGFFLSTLGMKASAEKYYARLTV